MRAFNQAQRVYNSPKIFTNQIKAKIILTIIPQSDLIIWVAKEILTKIMEKSSKDKLNNLKKIMLLKLPKFLIS